MFVLPPLPYTKTALAPFLNEEQMTLHYEKHHKSYVDNLNKLLETDPELKAKSLEEIIITSTGSTFNNAAQIWNHTFFWLCMAPANQGGTPSVGLSEAIKRDFGNNDALKSKFVDAGVKTFGSGWVWLCLHDSGQLSVESTANAAVPYKDVASAIPLLVADVWEHAYYVDYRNLRQKYLENFWEHINWQFVSENFSSKKIRNLTALHMKLNS